MKNIRRSLVVLITLFVSLALTTTVFAHPLGNFTINQYVGLTISRDKVLVDYVVDMAEIPAFQEIASFDTNGNGQMDSSESAGYHADKCASLQPDLNLLLNNQPAALTLVSSSVGFPAGVGGLSTLRLNCKYQALLDSSGSTLNLSFVNNAFPDRLGWKEIVISPDGVSLQGEFSETSLSNRLTNYPQDLLTNPLDQRQTEFGITSSAYPIQGAPDSVTEQNTPTLHKLCAFINEPWNATLLEYYSQHESSRDPTRFHPQNPQVYPQTGVPSGRWQICILVGRAQALPSQTAEMAQKCRSPEQTHLVLPLPHPPDC